MGQPTFSPVKKLTGGNSGLSNDAWLDQRGMYSQFFFIRIDAPRPLINDIWVFLFLTIDAECLKWASRAGTTVYVKAFIVNVNKCVKPFFLEQHYNIVNTVTLQSFWYISRHGPCIYCLPETKYLEYQAYHPHSVHWPHEKNLKQQKWPQKPLESTQNYPQNLQTPKIFIFLPSPTPQKYSLKFKNLNSKNEPSLRMCENIRVHPLLGLDLFTCLQNIKGNFKIRSWETIQKLSRGDNNSWPAYQMYWHKRSTQNMPCQNHWPVKG